jgi:hypothetical protein
MRPGVEELVVRFSMKVHFQDTEKTERSKWVHGFFMMLSRLNGVDHPYRMGSSVASALRECAQQQRSVCDPHPVKISFSAAALYIAPKMRYV